MMPAIITTATIPAIMLWACPGFVDRRGLGIRVADLTAFCPPLWGNLLVRPRASFRPGLHISDAVVSSGCQGWPARQRCGLPQCFQAAPRQARARRHADVLRARESPPQSDA